LTSGDVVKYGGEVMVFLAADDLGGAFFDDVLIPVIFVGTAVIAGYLVATELAAAPDENIDDGESTGEEAAREFKKPKPGGGGREGATDVPSWARGERPYVGESGKEYAKRVLDKQFGKGNWETGKSPKGKGPGSFFNQIKKYGDRHFE
jgi:hypothetical protein